MNTPTLRSQVQIVPAFAQPQPGSAFYAYRTAENAPVFNSLTGYVSGARYGDLANDVDRTTCAACRQWVALDAVCLCRRTFPALAFTPAAPPEGKQDATARFEINACPEAPLLPPAWPTVACLLLTCALAASLFALAIKTNTARHHAQDAQRSAQYRAIYAQKGDHRP